VTTAETPECSICKDPMVQLPRNGVNGTAMFACATGKDGNRPCDGGLYRNATRPSP
jgi:hypothetical protein